VKIKTIKSWDWKNNTCLKTFLGHSALIFKITIHTTDIFSSQSADGNLGIWNLWSGECKLSLNREKKLIWSINKFSDKIHVCLGDERTIRISEISPSLFSEKIRINAL